MEILILISVIIALLNVNMGFGVFLWSTFDNALGDENLIDIPNFAIGLLVFTLWPILVYKFLKKRYVL